VSIVKNSPALKGEGVLSYYKDRESARVKDTDVDSTRREGEVFGLHKFF
jgi:hypothetical protein